jgi:hypothetical protein
MLLGQSRMWSNLCSACGAAATDKMCAGTNASVGKRMTSFSRSGVPQLEASTHGSLEASLVCEYVGGTCFVRRNESGRGLCEGVGGHQPSI